MDVSVLTRPLRLPLLHVLDEVVVFPVAATSKALLPMERLAVVTALTARQASVTRGIVELLEVRFWRNGSDESGACRRKRGRTLTRVSVSVRAV
jgi:hypothetical protein